MTSSRAASTKPAIQISNLTVSRDDSIICQVPKVMVDHHSAVAITGPNGSGKSTLLRVLAGLETSVRGECKVDFTVRDRAFVHQSPFLFSGTVLSNVEYGLKAKGITKADRWERANLWLERFGIAHLATRSVKSLSGGEGRRTALARACVLEPRLLLLDEPLADLDQQGIDCVIRSLSELPESTILISSPSSLPDGLVRNEIQINSPVK